MTQCEATSRSRVVIENTRVGPWICQRAGGKFSPETSQCIGLERDGDLVAGVLFEGYNGRSIRMHVASDGTRQWLTREFLAVAFAYPFLQLKVQKILGLVDSTNENAMAFDKALGFKVEHIIEGAGKTGSLVILSMSEADCRWLRLGARYGFQA